MRHRMTVILLGLMMATLAGPTAAQDAPPTAPPAEQPSGQPPMITRTNGRLLLNFRDTPLDEVLEYLSEAAGLVVIKDTSITGRVSVVSKQPLTIEESVQVLNSVLKDRGFAAVRVGRTLKIVELSKAKQQSIPVFRGNDAQEIEPTDEIITQIIPIRYAVAKKIVENISTLLPTYADVSANETSNALIVTDTAANIRRIIQIVNALDTSVQAEAQVRVFHLQYADAQDTARLIEDVFREDETGRQNQSNLPFFARFRGGGNRGQKDENAGRPGKKVTAAADDRTNAVVVSGSPEVLDVIEEMIAKLDSDPVAKQEVLIYHLNNGNATDLATVLNTLFADTESTGSTRGGSSRNRNSSRQNGRGGGGFLAALAQSANTDTGGAADLVGQVEVVAEEATNSLLILTPKKNHPRVLEILKEIDRPLPQVLIKVLVAEVTLDDSLDLGLEFTGTVDTGDGTFNLGQNFGLAGATSGLTVNLIQGDYTAALHALATEGKLDVLSRPYILTSDNHEATITVGEEIPIPRNAQITDQGNTNTTVEFRDIGIILNVTPHINPEGVVIMDIAPEISSLSGQTIQVSEDFQGVVIAKRSAETRVAIRDGQTIVIGGLMQDKLTETINKVPFFGDIPLLGELFKRREKTKNKTELLIFLTPHVAQTPQRLEKMSDDERGGNEIVPKAVKPGMFQHYLQGMRRGSIRPENDEQYDRMQSPDEPESPTPKE